MAQSRHLGYIEASGVALPMRSSGRRVRVRESWADDGNEGGVECTFISFLPVSTITPRTPWLVHPYLMVNADQTLIAFLWVP